MRLKGLSVLLCLLGVVTARAEVIEGSRAFTFPENDNGLIELQQKGGDARKPGAVKVEFFGHMAFRITSPEGVTVLIDPWRNDPSGYWGKWYPKDFPEVPVDLVVETHAHFDHDAVQRPHALMVLERPVGSFTLADLTLTGLAEKHQCHSDGELKWDHIATEFNFSLCPPNNPLSFDNTIQIIETGGLRIAHWGDNRPNPSPAVEAKLKNLDVLILPIDGSEHILTYGQVAEILKKYQPKVVIPAHYLAAGSESVLSGLKNADEWVGKQKDVRRISGGEVTISASDLAGARGRVYYFGDGVKTK
jgi:L-ascorbate metabolism protein UlaG (beta-lactamase superfamily)